MFDQHTRASLVVVAQAALGRQPFALDQHKAPFEKPVHGAGGEHKNAVQSQRPSALFDVFEDALAIALTLGGRVNGERGHFAGFLLGVGVERGAAEDDAVVLQYRVVADVAFDFGAATLDQHALFFQRLDELQDAAHVVGRGLPQMFEMLVGDHGAHAVVGEEFEQQRAVDGKRHDVRTRHAAAHGAYRVAQIKRGVGGLLRIGQARQQALGLRHGQFGDEVVRVVDHAVHLGDQHELFRLDGRAHAAGHVFHAEVEGFTRGRVAEGRHEHDRAIFKRALNGGRIDLADQPGVLEIKAVDHAHGAGDDEIAGDHAHGGAGHRRVGQALRERSFNLEAQLARRFLRGIERDFIGHPHAVRVARADAFFAQLRFDLRTKAVHEHDAHAHRGEQRNVLHQRVEASGRDQFAGDGDHKGLAAMGMDVRRDGAQPIDELFLLGDHGPIIRKCRVAFVFDVFHARIHRRPTPSPAPCCRAAQACGGHARGRSALS